MRVNLMQMDNKMFLLIRGLLALAMNTDIETSGKELEAHIINGGSLNETMENSTGKISKPLNKLTLPTFEIKMSYYSVGEVMRSALD